MQKMDGKSLDLVEVNRRAVMEALKEVAPEVVSEGGVDLEKLAVLIGEDKNLSDKLERYNFTWPDKRKAIKSALTPSSGTLRPAPKESVNWDNTKNLYIEGDNLEVLKLLQKSYFGKIKMIYIDPPYNTGKEFVYPDDYADNIQNYLELTGQINESGRRITTNTETSGRYHTNWLNMMYPRLKLARNLLRDDGVIFISIDDHEVSNLRKICDEIFGEENFVGNIICKTATDNNKTQIACEHEYITCYVKSSETQYSWEATSINGEKIIDKYKVLRSTYGYDLTTIQSKLRIWIKENETDLQGVSHYSYVDDKGVFYPGNSANTKKGDYYYDVIHPKTKKICAKPENGYRWPLKTLLAADKNNDVLWGDDETTIPKIKKRLESVVDKLKSYYYEDSRKNTSEFKELFDNKSLRVKDTQFVYSKAGLDINRGEISTKNERTSIEFNDGEKLALPDIVSFLQSETSLKRKTIVEILVRSKRIGDFKRNPQQFIEDVLKIIKLKMKAMIVDGVKYHKISSYYAQELLDSEELNSYLDKMMESKKSVYDYVVYDSAVESRFAEEMEKNDKVKLYVKLPDWFKINTPLGTYNPDWAVLVEDEYKQKKLFFVLETKGVLFEEQLALEQRLKIHCGKRHFEALESGIDYEMTNSFEDFRSMFSH